MVAVPQRFCWVHCSNFLCIKMTESLLQGPWSVEGPFHRYLLVEQHADEQCRAVALQQAVGFDNARDVKVAGAWFRHTAG